MLPSWASSILTYQVLGVNPIFQISIHILCQENLPQYPKTDCLPPFILSHLGVSIPLQHSSWSVTNTCVYWFTARLSPADWDLHEDRTSPTLVAHYIFAEWMNESWISQQKTELASTSPADTYNIFSPLNCESLTAWAILFGNSSYAVQWRVFSILLGCFFTFLILLNF